MKIKNSSYLIGMQHVSKALVYAQSLSDGRRRTLCHKLSVMVYEAQQKVYSLAM